MSKMILIEEATVQQVLEALQEVYWSSRSAKHDEAITALKALAEQPAQQEPVSVLDCGEAGHADGACGNRECLPSFRRNTPQPAQREPLTDEEITAISKQVAEGGPNDSIDRFTRAIEAAHGIKEKNT